jgi:hypothetical protein
MCGRTPGYGYGWPRRAAAPCFDTPADDEWAEIRDFGNYTVWVETVDSTLLEGGRPGDAVGVFWNVVTGDRQIRQRLLALSDIDRAFTYEFCEPSPGIPPGYRGTVRVTPVVDGDRSFVEWWASFDSAPEDAPRWVDQFEVSFAGWLGSLRNHLLQRAGVGGSRPGR